MAIRNPGTFYSSATGTKDWTAPQSDALWQEKVKTLFDPCPTGWRVPQSGDGTSGNSPWTNFEIPGTSSVNAEARYEIGAMGGYRFYRAGNSGPTCWYPACGSRSAESASLYRSGDAGYEWTAPLSGSAVVFLNYNAAGRMLLYDSERRAFGFPVRCIRE